MSQLQTEHRTARVSCSLSKWNQETKQYDTTPRAGTIELKVNFQALMEDLGAKALRNKTGRTSLHHSHITAKVLRWENK